MENKKRYYVPKVFVRGIINDVKCHASWMSGDEGTSPARLAMRDSNGTWFGDAKFINDVGFTPKNSTKAEVTLNKTLSGNVWTYDNDKVSGLKIGKSKDRYSYSNTIIDPRGFETQIESPEIRRFIDYVCSGVINVDGAKLSGEFVYAIDRHGKNPVYLPVDSDEYKNDCEIEISADDTKAKNTELRKKFNALKLGDILEAGNDTFYVCLGDIDIPTSNNIISLAQLTTDRCSAISVFFKNDAKKTVEDAAAEYSNKHYWNTIKPYIEEHDLPKIAKRKAFMSIGRYQYWYGKYKLPVFDKNHAIIAVNKDKAQREDQFLPRFHSIVTLDKNSAFKHSSEVISDFNVLNRRLPYVKTGDADAWSKALIEFKNDVDSFISIFKNMPVGKNSSEDLTTYLTGIYNDPNKMKYFYFEDSCYY